MYFLLLEYFLLPVPTLCQTSLLFYKQCTVFDLCDFIGHLPFVPTEDAENLLDRMTYSMNGCKHPKYSYEVKMAKGAELTKYVDDEHLKPVDHYLLDADLFRLAFKFYPTEMHDGSFFTIPGLLEQWVDLKFRSHKEVKDIFTEFLAEEYDMFVENTDYPNSAP